MKTLHYPARYAALTEEEKRNANGGGELRDAWDSFTEQLRLDDVFFGGGLISLSITFIPTLLFNVAVAGYNFASNLYTGIRKTLGIRDDTLDAVQSYTEDIRNKKQSAAESI